MDEHLEFAGISCMLSHVVLPDPFALSVPGVHVSSPDSLGNGGIEPGSSIMRNGVELGGDVLVVATDVFHAEVAVEKGAVRDGAHQLLEKLSPMD